MSQNHTKKLSQDLVVTAKVNLSSVILLCRRVLHINNIREFPQEFLLGQSLTYQPKSKKHEELSLVDTCYRFDNLTGCDLKGTSIREVFQ